MSKRHRVDQKLETKYKALVELEKGKSNKEVAQSFGIPPNTLSTWKKNKEKVFEAYNKGNAKTKRMKSDTYEQVNNAVLKWFTRIRAENVPVSGILIKEKALYFAKELNFEKVSGSVDYKDSSEDDDFDDFDNEGPTELLTKPDFKDAMNAISILEDYSIFTKFGVDLRKALNDASRVLELDHHVNKRQSKIEDFFEKS